MFSAGRGRQQLDLTWLCNQIGLVSQTRARGICVDLYNRVDPCNEDLREVLAVHNVCGPDAWYITFSPRPI